MEFWLYICEKWPKLISQTKILSDEIWLKFERESQFCRWYAALKLGCKGTTMASNNYKNEIDKLKQVIKIQDIPLDKIENPDKLAAVRTKFYVSKKLLKKVRFINVAEI